MHKRGGVADAMFQSFYSAEDNRFKQQNFSICLLKTGCFKALAG